MPPPGDGSDSDSDGSVPVAPDDSQPERPLPITFGGAGAGSGVYIRNQVEAAIRDSVVTTTITGVSVEAFDHAQILSDAGGIALSLRLRDSDDSSTSVNGTVGASAVVNDISTNVLALIEESTVNSASKRARHIGLRPKDSRTCHRWCCDCNARRWRRI